MATIKNSQLFEKHTGILTKDACVVLVKTEWNASIVNQLERGCIAQLEEADVKKIIVISVPGAIEIPFAISHFWRHATKKNKPDAFIALGCIIQGETPHFDYVCQSVTNGVLHLNLNLPVPTIFGVLTVLNEEQAVNRIGGKDGHKGEEAAMTAIKMMNLTYLSKKKKN